MKDATRRTLAEIAEEHGTPTYVYFLDEIQHRTKQVVEAFAGRFAVSYAVKANPNLAVLSALKDVVATFDCSSIGEVEKVVSIGVPATRITFSGPAKRLEEIERGVELGVGEFVCESEWEISVLNRVAGANGKTFPFFIRINPSYVPRRFGASMSGRASQFGIDEEVLSSVLVQLSSWANLDLAGFHIYSGSNCLHAEAIVENFQGFVNHFRRFSGEIGLAPSKLIFGSGFGISYVDPEDTLDLAAVAAKSVPLVDDLESNPTFASTKCVLEMGRYLVGPAGYLLTSVINLKSSRNTEIGLCDAGFNNHLAACGMMGGVRRRNWPIQKISGRPGEERAYMLTGPLCTTIDRLAKDIHLPLLERGDVLAVQQSGAYGFSASPRSFISHPEPKEIVVAGDDHRIIDVSGDLAADDFR